MLIHILIHPLDDFDHSGYLLPRIMPVWQKQGIRFQVIKNLSQADGRADAAINHIDLTRIPHEYNAIFARYPVVINARPRDISKRVISRHLVTKSDAYEGPVIVKTDRNCGGIKEAEVARNAGVLRKYARSLHRRLPWYLRNELPGKKYPLFESKHDVPWPVWHNPALVVEQYLNEHHEGVNWLRTWHFFGDRETLALRWANHHIVAQPHLLGAKFVSPDIPPEIRALRHELGFDFGKFDFAVVNGTPVLYDTNRTPTNRSLSAEEMHMLTTTLAAGLPSLLATAK
ncbi:MAG: hypothetical protein U0640_10870 [Phycisphaerales bacterium]